MTTKKKTTEYPLSLILILLFAALSALIVISLCLGKYPVSAKDCFSVLSRALLGKPQLLDEMTVNVVLRLRLPRILAAVFVGAALSASGSAYQGIFQNPLVSPDFLGVSSGACIGAAIGILLGLTSASVSVIAFFGGIAAVLITVSIPSLLKNQSNIVLVLAGIITGSLMSSILGFLKYVADPQTQLASITYWTMGDFSYVDTSDLLTMVVVLLPPMILLMAMSWWLDVLSMGDSEARTLGADVKLIKTIAIICSTLLTSGSVCICGTIGWVGLIIPHFARMITGPSNRRLLPASILLGSIFMLTVDTLTKTIGTNEMPVSIMTGIVGAPFFFWLLTKRRDSLG